MAIPIDPKLRKAYDFFKKHAGYVVGKQAEGALALALARAEAAACALGWEVMWEMDTEEYQLGDEEDEPDEVFYAELLDADQVLLEALGGIADPDNNYRRVVEAELALEALVRKKLL